MARTWGKLRDTYEGREALLCGKERYLPRPTKMDEARYDSYRNRAKHFGATRRTVHAFEGLAFRQPLSVAVPASMTPHLEALTTTGVSLDGLAKLIFRETLLLGRYGVLVDFDAMGARPFLAGYPAERILNWSTAVIGGQRQLTQVVLAETDYRTTADGFTEESVDAVRVLRLLDGLYTQTLYLYSNAGVVVETVDVVPTRQGAALDFLPFVFFGVNDLEPSLELSTLNDLADTNLAYWRHSADYEWSLHLTASPTPWVTGHDASLDIGPDGWPETELILGSDQAIILREPEAKIGILEFQGQGLEPLRQAMLDDKQEMAALGARLLEGPPKGNETLGAFQMRSLGDTSLIACLATSLSAGLSRLLQYHAYWFGAATQPNEAKIHVALPTNFTTVRLEPPLLQALMAALQAGHISQETFYWNLQQGELAQPGIDFAQEQARIEAQAPAMVRLLPGEHQGLPQPGEAAA